MKKLSILQVACAATLLATPHLIAQTPAAPVRGDNPPSAAAAAAKAEEFVPDEILVGFKPGAAAARREEARGAIGAKKLKEFAGIGVQHWKLPPGLTVARAIEILSANPNVRFAEPNYIVRTQDVTPPNDALRGELWGLHNVGQNAGTSDADIDALEAWLDPNVQGPGSVVVGVIDTGIDYTHPDLVDKMWVNPREIADNGVDDDGNDYIDDVRGWDFVNNDHDPMDDNRHGTHVAGTIAGAGNNAVGVIGVAGLNPNVKLVPIKFLDAGGSGTTDNAISAVLYAASLKDADGNQIVRITNNSWGGGASSEALKAAIETSNALFVAAAGNGASSNLHYPSAYALPNVLAVAATDSKDNLASFSNYGSWVHLAAPGVSIISTTPGDTYTRLNGTSMATPHAAGAAALVLSQNPGWSSETIKNQLLGTGDSVTALSGKVATGKRLNVASALGAVALSEDTTTPGTVSNLVANQPTQTSVDLHWSPPGDTSAAYLYEVRYRINAAVTESNWSSATPAYGEPVPEAGAAVSLMVGDLSPGTQYHFAIKVLNRSGLASSITATGPIQTGPLGWQPLLVDPVGDPYDFRSFVSLAFNASGNPVFAYFDYPNSRTKIATWTGSAWSFELVGNDYGAMSLALDAAGKPSLSWANGVNLYFSTKASAKWSTATVDRGRVSRYSPSSLAYWIGNPAISYRFSDGTTDGLKFAWRSGSTWKTHLIEGGPVGAYYTDYCSSSLAFSPNGRATIAYTTDETDDVQLDTLKLAEGTGTGPGASWTTSIVEEGIYNYSGICSLAFDSAGNPVIADSANGAVRLLRRAGNNWIEQVVDSGSTCDLSVNPSNNKADIAYRSGGKVKVASATLDPNPSVAASWTLQIADFEGPGSSKPAIRPGLNQTPHVGYFAGTELRLIKQNPSYQGPSYLFQDSMEDSTSSWTTEGDRNDPTVKTKPPGPDNPARGNLWHQTTRRGTDPGHSPVTSWYYGDESMGTYDTGTRNWGRLKSGAITLPAGSRAELQVSQLALVEGSRYENGEIQVSVEGGSWTTIFQRGSRTNTAFITDKLDLTPYLGKTIRLGFFLDTKDGNFNQYEGWYLDVVSVKWWP